MQQPISRRGVYGPSMSAVVNGKAVEVSQVAVDRALPDPFTGGSLTSASASFTAVEGEDVTSKVATPWDPSTSWPPVPQSSASVSMDTGAGPVSLLANGVVMSASGGTSGREVEVEAADAYESLNRTISWDAVASHMPSLEEAEHGRYVGMQTASITDMILRHCGWYATPHLPNYTMLSVPAQGSMWPERGYVTESNRVDGGGYPRWLNADWGVSAADVDATYTLQGGGYTLQGRGGLEFAAMTQTSQSSASGIFWLDVRSENWDARIRLQWSDSVGYVRFAGADGVYESVLSVPRTDGFLYATIRYISATRVEVTLQSGLRTVSATVTVPSSVTTGELRVGRIRGEGRGGGFIVAAPSQLGTLADWVPNAVLYPRVSGRNALSVRPSVEGENCADLLAAQCEAEAATYWIDELGVLRWWDLARLEAQSTVATLTSDDDIAESGFSWSHSLSSVKSRSVVKWREPLAHRSWRTNVDLYQESGRTLQPGDVIEDWLKVPDDEVWIMPDTTLSRAGTHSMNDLNYGIGSWYGGVLAGTGDDADRWAYGTGNPGTGSLLMTVERVTDRAFKTWIQWTGSVPVVQRTPSERSSSSLWLARRNMDLPVIRGKLKITMLDQLTYSGQTGEPTAPEHEIDAGWWIQSEEQAQYTADYAGARLTVAQPVLSSVALIPFPGLQLGDVVEVYDEAVTGLSIRGVVVEDSRSIDADMGMSHSVAIRPTHISRPGLTWQEWGEYMAERSWETWGDEQQPKTWEQWGENPLDGEVL